jgi:hypothetical protein
VRRVNHNDFHERATHAELLVLVRDLLARVKVLEAENGPLKAENVQLKAENAKLREESRVDKRATAPFSKGKGKANPKQPGRKAGKGIFTNRPEPQPAPSDIVEDIEVALNSANCPRCGADLEVKQETATVEDAPPQPIRVIKRFHVEVGYCPVCNWRGRGQHAELPAGQHGATAHRVGPYIMGKALELHYHCGLPLCKVPAVLRSFTGLALSQSAITQAVGTLCAPGGNLHATYLELREEVKTSPVVNTDDTGWSIGGKLAFLMGFFTPDLAVFQVRWRHRHQEVLEVLGAAFDGLLGTDRGSSYEAQAMSEIKQQKCLSHLLKNLSAVEETKKGRAKTFARNLKETLREANQLWNDYRKGECTLETYRERGLPIREKLTDELRHRVLKDRDNQRLLDGIGYQHRNGKVLLFLERPEIEPTNNRAERGLRGGVIARKVSHCSKNERGAGIYEVMKSITATVALRGFQVATTLADMLTGKPMPKAPSR